MIRRRRIPTPDNAAQATIALDLLRKAGKLLRRAGCANAHTATRRAIKSTEGALRHIETKTDKGVEP